MANWKITKDNISGEVGEKSDVGVGSIGIEKIDESTLTEKFQLKDDDGFIHYEGISDDSQTEGAFDPLDNFGQPNTGCTSIYYLDKQSGRYEPL